MQLGLCMPFSASMDSENGRFLDSIRFTISSHVIITPLPTTLLLLPIQRLSRLRAHLQHSCHPIQQSLVLDPLAALQQLDLARRRVHLARQLRLRHFIRLLTAAVADRRANFCTGFLHGDNIVRAVDFC